jgi:hypothetical protein
MGLNFSGVLYTPNLHMYGDSYLICSYSVDLQQKQAWFSLIIQFPPCRRIEDVEALRVVHK